MGWSDWADRTAIIQTMTDYTKVTVMIWIIIDVISGIALYTAHVIVQEQRLLWQSFTSEWRVARMQGNSVRYAYLPPAISLCLY